jgi:hypothetical protein
MLYKLFCSKIDYKFYQNYYKESVRMSIKSLKYFSLVLIFAGSIIGCGSSDLELTESDEEITLDNELDNKLPGGMPIEDAVKSHDKLTENSDSGSPYKKNKEETKFSKTETVKKTFAVQIAAFNDEENAKQYIETQKELLKGYSLYCKNQDNLYKVLIGSYNSLDLAGNKLREVYSMGYNDTFILELSSAKK